jgi:pimeloyl-ACP methyl ester carboxylesterase
MTTLVRGLAVLASAFFLGACSTTGLEERAVKAEEFKLASPAPGVQLYVRNKAPADMTRFASDKTVLFVHGATYPASQTFDLQLDGISWMDYIARQGYDVYLVDVRGYGRSTRPAAMSQPPEANPPFATTEEAAADVAAAVDFIRKRRGVEKLNLIGWSWGTAIMSYYTERNNDKVSKLVLYAPLHVRQTASLVQTGPGPLGAYRTVTVDAARKRWVTGVPAAKVGSLIPPGWFDAWAKANLDADADGAKRSPAVIRAPNGVVLDGQRYWGAGKSIYDPAQIRVPTLLVKGEWDVDTPAYMAQNVFAGLVNSPYKRYIEIGEGTHTIMMERNRMQLFTAVQQFLDEGKPR